MRTKVDAEPVFWFEFVKSIKRYGKNVIFRDPEQVYKSSVEGVEFAIQSAGSFRKNCHCPFFGLFLQAFKHSTRIFYIADSHWNIISHQKHLFKKGDSK